jgi:peptidoglycan/LPS O-acetylase OafA/YrhL
VTSTPDADVAGRRSSVVHLESLTALRFFAAMVVVVHHAGWMGTPSATASQVLELGYVGVSFFFVLSGFVLTWSLSATRTTRRFYWLRFARIWPLHAVTTAYAGLVIARQFWIPDTSGILAVITCTQAFSTSKYTYYGLNGVSWSLSCEALFYLLFPLLVTTVLRRSRRVLWALAVLDVSALLLVPAISYHVAGPTGWASRHADWLFFINPTFRIGEFVLGIILGSLFRSGWRPTLSLPTAVCGTAVTAGLLAWLQVAHGVHTPRPYVAALLLPWFGLVIATAAGNDAAGRASVLRARSLVFLGEASFALYLTHQLVQRTVDWERVTSGREVASASAFGLYLVVALVVASLTHLCVERPAESWLRRRRIGVRADPGEVGVEKPRLSDQLTRAVVGTDPPHPVGGDPQLVALPLDDPADVVVPELAARHLGKPRRGQ